MPATPSLLTDQQIVELLTCRKETTNQDYRREVPPRGHKTCAVLDLLKDVVALANVGGGVVVFGVDDASYAPIGRRGGLPGPTGRTFRMILLNECWRGVPGASRA